MAATIYVAANYREPPRSPPDRSVFLDDTGCYWHLYRYFEGANLKFEHTEELVDLYGGREIDGYQLDRLEDELIAAREDAGHKADEWRVLIGWSGVPPSRANERWSSVKKAELLEIIAKLLWLIEFARTNQLKLVVSGD